MKKLTFDTGLLIKVIDKKSGCDDVLKILNWHTEGNISVNVSSRVFHPDLLKMNIEQKGKIKALIKKYNICIKENIFKSQISVLSGRDLLSGASTNRSDNEIELFREVVGEDPTQLAPESIGNKLPNKIGDYDALYEHFCSFRDFFITYDAKDYFHKLKRKKYENELGIIILCPEDYISRYEQQNT